MLINDTEADGAHQLESVAGLHDSGLEFVIENQPALFDAVLEMEIGCALAKGRGDLGEGEIVGADHTDGVVGQEFAEYKLGSRKPVVGVGAGQQFIQQKE